MIEQLKKNSTDNISTNNDTASIRWVMLIYFCSGLCSLIDEVVWVRLIKLTLGNTVYASTIVVSIFMGGLALGSLIMGRFADRIRRKLKLYAILEICITVSASCHCEAKHHASVPSIRIGCDDHPHGGANWRCVG